MTATISRDDIFKVLASRYHELLTSRGGWHFVRLWPDGTITDGVEPSPCYPESEYYGRRPHPVTIWSSSMQSGDLTDDEIAAEMDATDDDWFDREVPDLAERIRPTGLKLEE